MTKNYVNGIEYSGATLEAIYFSEGRCTPNGATAFNYDYALKDHLGNTRVNFRQNGTGITGLEELHYYPFGMLIEGLSVSSPTNDYSYNGKELNEDFGLNLYDYGARWYDAAVGRWWSVDPMAIKAFSSTPYNYVENSPLIGVDPTGMFGVSYGKDGYSSAREWQEAKWQEYQESQLNQHLQRTVNQYFEQRLQDENGKILFSATGGSKISQIDGSSGKTEVWVTDQQSSDYDPNYPWASAMPLTYGIAISGATFIDGHPLKNIAVRKGQQVFLEELVDMTNQFLDVLADGLPEFGALRKADNFAVKSLLFKGLVTDDAKYDLKSRITSDGTPSFAAVVIGEWSLFRGTLRKYDDYGNISFGFWGNHAGFNLSYLKLGSNINQIAKDLRGVTHGMGDDGRDVFMIKLGFYFYNSIYETRP